MGKLGKNPEAMTPRDEKAKEIDDVRAEDINRARRGRTDVRTARERERFRKDIQRLFDAGDENGFILALQRARIPEPQFSEALREWRELQKTRPNRGRL